MESTTAALAAAFGGMLFGADALTAEKVTLDPKTAKELMIISRVLEKRLSDTRKYLAEAAAARVATPNSAGRETTLPESGT